MSEFKPLSDDSRAIIAAVADALNVPPAADTPEGVRERADLIRNRATVVRSTLTWLGANADRELLLERHLEILREQVAEFAVSYEQPVPGSEIPGQPGYVVGTCGHRLPASEWRWGYRTCEPCGHDWEDQGNNADGFACEHKTLDDPGHDNAVCPRVPREVWDRMMRGGEGRG